MLELTQPVQWERPNFGSLKCDIISSVSKLQQEYVLCIIYIQNSNWRYIDSLINIHTGPTCRIQCILWKLFIR